MSVPQFAGRFAALISRFRRDKKANIAVIFAIAILPVLSFVGAAVDYSLATRMKAKLQSAADAASVAAISKNSIGYNAAALMSGDGPVPIAVTDANNVFNGNLANMNLADYTLTNSSPVSTVTKTGGTLNSQVQFSADVPVIFMKVLGYQKLTVTGISQSTSSLPPYLDFYLMLDLSGSMGLPVSDAEQSRLAAINPDDFSAYPLGCTFACHFQASGSCSNPSVGQKINPSGALSPVNSAYPTNNYCLGYLISRLSPTAYANLLQSTPNYPMKGKQLPPNILANLTSSLTGTPNSLITGNSASVTSPPKGPPYSLTPVTSCPTEGTDNCIQLRADAVGVALNATVAVNGVDGLFAAANNYKIVTNQFRIGIYPFIQKLITYVPLTSTINASPTTPGTINYAAANLATLLDTGNTPDLGLGSGGTHFDNAFRTMNTTIVTVGNGTTPTNTKPFVFLVTDGAQDNQTCCGFAGNNGATVMPMGATSYCKPLKDRGITIAVLYIPYSPIQNPTHIFNNEDYVANANIPNIEPSLQDCASPGFYFSASTQQGITGALTKMFQQALQTAHITN
jgi:Flp pilus assembly protein TadG